MAHMLLVVLGHLPCLCLTNVTSWLVLFLLLSFSPFSGRQSLPSSLYKGTWNAGYPLYAFLLPIFEEFVGDLEIASPSPNRWASVGRTKRTNAMLGSIFRASKRAIKGERTLWPILLKLGYSCLMLVRWYTDDFHLLQYISHLTCHTVYRILYMRIYTDLPAFYKYSPWKWFLTLEQTYSTHLL